MKNQLHEDLSPQTGNNKIKFYTVGKNAFFLKFLAKNNRIALHRQAMLELQERYGILSKRILSVGPGDCEQEYWFTEKSNRLLLIDIDEAGSIARRLKTMPAEDNDADNLIYAIGDARALAEYRDHQFEVFLNFGFTPDDLHRAEVLRNNINMLFGWPVGASPFCPLVMEICDLLPPGGLFISLNYCGGPDATLITYLPAVQQQLSEHNLCLLDAYALHDSPGVHMLVAQKGASDILPPRTVPITLMHTRSSEPSHPVQIFSINTPITFPTQTVAREITKDIIMAVHPDARNCLYRGVESNEIRAILEMGIDVTAIAERNSPNKFRSANNYGQLSFSDGRIKHDTFDIVWLSEAYDEHGAELINQLNSPSAPAYLLFSGASHSLMDKIAENGTLLIFGQVGLEINSHHVFVSKLRQELSIHKINLEALYVLRVATGIFLAIGKKPGSPASEHITRFWPKAEDSSAICVDLSIPLQ